MQPDGNLVMYRDYSQNGNGAVWASNTNDRWALWKVEKTILQNDGNLVIYDRGGKARWASGSNGCGISWNYMAVMQDDGNLVIYFYNNSLGRWVPLWDRFGRRYDCSGRPR